MDRCVVLVDAGYLLGAAASLLAGEPARARITVDHAALIQGLRERAEADTDRPLLRIYWFDGAPDRVPQPEHRRLRVMPRVTVRLGALTRTEGRWAQKGVDAAMHAELTELARNRACSDIVLVTGDGDLLPGLMDAKEHGVAIHLWAVQAADGDFNQSEDLVAEADERRVLDRAWITQAVRAKEVAGPCAAPAAPEPEIAAILSAPLPEASASGAPPAPGGGPDAGLATANGASPGAGSPAGAVNGLVNGRGATGRLPSPNGAGPAGAEPSVNGAGPAVDGAGGDGAGGAKGVPTPKDLAGLGRAHAAGAAGAGGPSGQAGGPSVPNATLRWSSDRGWVERGGGPAEPPEIASLPTLAQLTSAEQRWADREEDITAVSGDPFEVGQVFARRWIERLSSGGQLQQLSMEYPRIPHRIDGELLRYAARFGLLAHKDDQIDEHDRYAIRAGFWREVDTRTATTRTATPRPVPPGG
ncbi:NYN domain-containing protein [Streptomyces pathocidini]|uniref:NYN domain-containing protein n=2 Tax=Streptomyces pathocidini TaxID=1650571 RepID=A0ABW7UXT5_9ACTN